jgi:hypothetical protein
LINRQGLRDDAGIKIVELVASARTRRRLLAGQ